MLWVGQLCIRKPVPYKYAVKLLDVRRFTLYSPGNTPLVVLISNQVPSP
jgi:hypothetical protein